MLLTAAAIYEIGRHWVAGSFTFFYLIQAEKAIFNLTISETDLNYTQRIQSVPIESCTMIHFMHSCMFVKMC